MAVVVIIWLICGVLAALIFQSKNREPWKGALWGLLLGVLGLFIAAMHGKRPRAGDDRQLSAPAAALPAIPLVPAGWYQDPTDPSLLRYWTGSDWTPHTARPAV